MFRFRVNAIKFEVSLKSIAFQQLMSLASIYSVSEIDRLLKVSGEPNKKKILYSMKIWLLPLKG